MNPSEGERERRERESERGIERRKETHGLTKWIKTEKETGERESY